MKTSNFNHEIFYQTVEYLENIQLKEMGYVGYEKDGLRNRNDVRILDIGNENYQILKDKYGIEKDQVRPLINEQFLKLLWPYSRFESPYSLSILSPILKSINKYIDKNNIATQDLIIIGTLTKGDLNSSIKRTPYGSKIVIFNEGAFSLFYTISKAICLLVPIHTFKEKLFNNKLDFKKKKVNKINEAYGRFSEVMEAYLNERDARSSIIYLQESIYMKYMDAVTTIGSGFIISHEYGHFLKKHLGEVKNKILELEADFVAFKIVMGGYENISTELKYLGIEFALLLSEAIQKITNVCVGTTHPIYQDRINYARTNLKNSINSLRYKSIINHANYQMDAFRLLTNKFMETNNFYNNCH